MRQLGRFLLEIRTLEPGVHNLFDVFYPKNYDVTILAVQTLAGLNADGTGFKIPSLATSLGTLLKFVSQLCISISIREQNKEKQMFAEDFLKLLQEDYSTSVNRTALETQSRKKRQKKVVLPSKSDIQKLQRYLRDSLRRNYEDLNEQFSRRAWIKLAEVALISIQLFNRRRAGEIERIFIEDFENYQKIDENTVGESFSKLSVEEKQAAQKYVRFTIRGKLNRTVPVLLHREVLVCLQLLLKHRQEMQVHKKNPYLFGIPGTVKGDYKYLRACVLMRKFATDCGAADPTTLRGTILRKHVATMCINFNLTENEVSDLANFLGHAEKIHRDHYRQPIITREILQISKLLEVVQGKDDEGEHDSEDDSGDDDGEESERMEAGEIGNATSTGAASKRVTFAAEQMSPRPSSNPSSGLEIEDDVLESEGPTKKRKRSSKDDFFPKELRVIYVYLILFSINFSFIYSFSFQPRRMEGAIVFVGLRKRLK